ncbi:MAG: hypothetical protein JW903_02620 [Clostridia bacterium]|nr:hypothetical protein [Clostridia bacterium]
MAIAAIVIWILILTGCINRNVVFENPTFTAISTQSPVPAQTAVVSKEPLEPAPTEVEQTPNEEEILMVTEGVFSYIEWGDYLHLYLIDFVNTVHSFFVLKYPGYDVESLEEGRKIKVYWRNVDVFLEAPQETINLNEVVKIEVME